MKLFTLFFFSLALLGFSTGTLANPAKQTESSAHSATEIAAIVVEVIGGRITLKLDNGQTLTVSTQGRFTESDVGKKISGKLAPLGDTQLLTEFTLQLAN